MIGVSGDPPDPATPFAELDDEKINEAWLSGAVHPMTTRGLAGILMSVLPKETLTKLGVLFIEASCEDVDGQPPKTIEALHKLSTCDSEGLNSFPNEPFVSIDPAASEKKIAESLNLQLKQWKEERALKERRDRSDKYDEQLQVWDLREGWAHGVYNRSAEKTFAEIAELTKRPISTINNQYCRAFEAITGHPYKRETWFMMFGTIKLQEVVGLGMARTQRPLKSPTPRLIPDSAVSGDSERPSVVETASSGDETGFRELLNDIATLIQKGRSDLEVCEELGLDADATDAIACLRRRGDMTALLS